MKRQMIGRHPSPMAVRHVGSSGATTTAAALPTAVASSRSVAGSGVRVVLQAAQRFSMRLKMFPALASFLLPSPPFPPAPPAEGAVVTTTCTAASALPGGGLAAAVCSLSSSSSRSSARLAAVVVAVEFASGGGLDFNISCTPRRNGGLGTTRPMSKNR